MSLKKNNLLHCMMIGIFSAFPLQAQTAPQQEIQNLRRLAEAFEQANLLSQAADYYIRLGLANPADLIAYLGARRTCKASGEWNKLRDFILSLQSRRRDVRYAVDLAWIDYQTGKKEEAKAEWHRILAENPKDTRVYSILGQTFTEEGLTEEAIDVYNAARKQLNQPGAFAFELAQLYSYIKNTEGMISEYLLIMSENPQQTAFVRDAFLQSETDPEKTLSILRKAERQKAEAAWAAALLRVDLAAKSTRYDEALQSASVFENYLKGLEGSKKSPPIHQGEVLYELAEELFRAGLSTNAEKALTQILQNSSDSPYAHAARRKMAQIYLSRNEFHQAEQILQQIGENARQRSERAEAFEMLGKICMEQLFDFAKAEAAFQRSFNEQADEKKRISLLLRLAECSLLRGDFAAAEEKLSTALDCSKAAENAVYVEILYQTAMLQLYSNEFHHAHETVREALQFPMNSESLMFENDLLRLSMLLQDAQGDSVGAAIWAQAELLRRSGRLQEAESLLSRRLTEMPASRFRDNLRLQLAQIYETQRKIDQAVKIYRAVYEDEKSPYRDFALYSIGLLFEETGEKQTAGTYYEKLLVEFPFSIHLDEARKRLRVFEKELP